MLIEKKDGIFNGGRADILCILHLPEGTYHAAFFEEHPMPGEIKPIEEEEFIRLKSKMHHTTGATTLEEAKAHLKELRGKIILPDSNVIADVAIPVDEPVNTWIAANWLKDGTNAKKALGIS